MSHVEIPIVFATDEKYIFPMGVAMASMLESAAEGTVYHYYVLVDKAFLPVCREIEEHLKKKFGNFSTSYLEFNQDTFCDVKTVHPHITSAAYYRLIISELMKEYDKCIYIDCDVLIAEDLSGLFAIDLKDSYVAGVKDMAVQQDAKITDKHREALGIPSMNQYIHSGMMVMDLKKIRSDHMADIFLAHMRKGYRFEDQDVVNVCCYGKITFLPVRFNLLNRYLDASERLDKTVYSACELDQADRPAIIHFASWNTKPWDNLRSRGSEKWWSTASIFSDMEVYRKTAESVNRWEEMINWEKFVERCRQKDNILIFGYSAIGKDLYHCLKKAGIQGIKYFCDNDRNKQGSEYEGISVQSIENVVEQYGVHKVFIINSSQLYGEQIKKQLIDMGISEEQILRYNHKDKSYYMALDQRFYEVELRLIYLREFGSAKVFDSRGYLDIVNGWKTAETVSEEEGRLISKYWLDSWLLGKCFGEQLN